MRNREDNTVTRLIEGAAGAHRERDASGLLMPPPAWWDLTPEGREALFEVQTETRFLERALDPRGLSATGKAVVARSLTLGQLPA